MILITGPRAEQALSQLLPNAKISLYYATVFFECLGGLDLGCVIIRSVAFAENLQSGPYVAAASDFDQIDLAQGFLPITENLLKTLGQTEDFLRLVPRAGTDTYKYWQNKGING